MAIRNILTEENPRLRKKCKVVKEIDDRVITLLDDMAETMYSAKGVGLAAPQVGILKRIVVIDTGDGLYEFINPEIIASEGEQIDEEGCLSVPDETAEVLRPNKVTLKALNRNGEEITVTGEELFARAMCHELDHLEGILFIDKALPREDDDFEYDE